MNAFPARTPSTAPMDHPPCTTTSGDTALDFVGVTAASRCTYYREVCQIPAVLDPLTDQIIVVAGHVQAVMVPAPLGRRIRAELDRRDEECGPIVSHPKSGLWTFLTRSEFRLDIPAADAASLWDHNVVVMASGVQIGLPTPTARNDDPVRLWELPPHSPQRPGTTTVLRAVRACVERGESR